MAKSFKLIGDFRGFRQKRDETKLPSGTLVKGSLNVLSTDGDRIAVRKGFTLDGASDTALTPIERSFEWDTHRGVQIPLRSFDDKLQFRTEVTGSVLWQTLETSFNSVAFNFTTFWDTTEKQDILLFVNNDSSIFDWSGGIATFASATSNTITKEGTTSWGEVGFLTAGTRQFELGGTTFTYTGGEGTTALTGVTPDPTGVGAVAGDIVFQTIRTTANSAITGVPNTFGNDLIEVLNNQIWLGSLTDREVFVSKVNSKTDFSFASPRATGEGALITLDGTPVGFVIQEDQMYISASSDQWYRAFFEFGTNITEESLKIKRLKTTTQEAAKVQSAIAKIKNNIVFINNEPTFDTLGRLENIATPQSTALSDPIKELFDDLDFTDTHIKFFRNQIFIAVPKENRVLIFNLEKGFWEAPQILSVSRLAVIGGSLFGHSSATPETFKLFDGRNDNSADITATANFSFQNFGRRANKKRFDEWYTEGFISTNTTVTMTLRYEFQGSEQILEFTIDGSDTTIIFASQTDASLGKNALGKEPLGTTGEALTGEEVPSKFRIIHTMIPSDVFEVQAEYKSDQSDANWELLTFGANAVPSKSDNNEIKK